jgi:hypothetical protein
MLYKYLQKRYWILFFVFGSFAAGCAEFSLNLRDRIKEIDRCQITVIDSRSDERVFIDALTITPTPPIREILYSKLCQRDEIQKFIRTGIELNVYISAIRCGQISNFFSSELVGSMTGQIKIRKPDEHEFYTYLIMPPPTKLKKFIFTGKTVYKDFIEYVTEGFVTEVEKTIYKLRECSVKQ